MEIKFRKPFVFEGEEYTSINFDLDSLTGEDIFEAERRFAGINPVNAANPTKEFSRQYQAIIASIAAKQPIEFFNKLPAHEMNRISVIVQNFLISGETDES